MMENAEILVPTAETYGQLQVAYRHLNTSLFAGKLPDCLLTLQRKKKTMGYFSRNRFVTETGKKTDEIALNPAFFAVRAQKEILQTIAHEMCHLWQFHFGKPGRGRYHNQEWAEKMVSIGLMPSSTGLPGGEKTGDSMCDYAIEGGVFDQACDALYATGFKVTWMDSFPEMPVGMPVPEFLQNETEGNGEGGEEPIKDKSNRVKYTCPECDTHVWGKPKLRLLCVDCNSKFDPFEAAEESEIEEDPDEED